VALSLFATTSIGIFMGTLARSMPQLGLLMILVLLPLQMLSGGSTPRESMPQAVQDIMLTMPTTHFVSLAQAILYRGADFAIVWPQFLTCWLSAACSLLSHCYVFVRRLADGMSDAGGRTSGDGGDKDVSACGSSRDVAAR
jgi:ABC-type multidrug transport system permease subunit